MKNSNYNIGLDIGVGSVGWCVTDEENNIIKRNGKNMWGSRIFKEAQTAKQRRNFRSSRRRLDRRKERINILQSLILEDINEEYPNFFQLLRESSLDYEDKITSQSILGIKYNLFTDEQMTDKTYYNNFKTIYHLRNYLINTTQKVDIRLVYLALHHIIKYRGNFLYEGNFSENTNEIANKVDEILDFLKEKYQIILKVDKSEIFNILTQKSISKSSKKEQIISLFNFEKQEKQIITNIVNSFLGYVFDLNKIFETNIEKSKISFSVEIENEEEIKEELQEYANIYENMNNIYSWFILQDILKGKTYISEALIHKYEKYSEDLKLLKNIYKKYFTSEYNEMFRKVKPNNYVAYNGKTANKKCKKCNSEEFFAMLKKKIETLPESCIEKEKIMKEIEDNSFLIKINVTDNGAIPHQLHQKELEKILENQSKYYKTLEENKEKIIKLFSFRIPYYVGPLSKNKGKWSWIVRKEDEKIRPWNFEKVVNEDATAEEFIKRMTNKCTYIINEDVIPKQSLLYSKFCVLNELNNIKLNEHYLGNDMKKKIIDKIFKVKKKVTLAMLKDFFNKEGFKVSTITGLADGNNFNSNMAAYIDIKNIFGEIDENNIEQCENIIYWITIFEEKKILKRKIKKEYPNLTEEQINKLCKLKYSGWSRLSKKLIDGIKSNDGETIIEKLEKTPYNFMQIINKKEYGFNKKIEELMPKTKNKITYKDIEEIPTSPANKRAIWQTICIVKEICKIMKNNPKNIYIEFARSEETKNKMKDNRIVQLLKKYKDIEEQLKYIKSYDNTVYKELKQHQSEKTLNEKMYLYYLQNGKCLYSGKPIDLSNLNKYEVDHIMPRTYIKDDSIDNKALVLKEENQRKKDNLLLSDSIIDSRIEWWKSLLEAGFISQTKYYRLTRRKMFETDDDREKFVKRQLVETRQITKYVTNILTNEYKEINIFALRAELTHNFRGKYKIYKNRNINNYHHAQDAYIISIIGNVLDKNWKGKEEFKYSEYVKKYMRDEKDKKEKHGMLIGLVSKNIDINKIKAVMNYKDCFISRMLEEETGEFYNQTLYSPKDKPVIPLKNNMSTNKYGGYSGEVKSYYTIYKYTNENQKDEYQLVGIPIQIAYKIKAGKESIQEYIKNTYLKGIEYKNLTIIKTKILKNQEYIDENNETMRFCSDTEIRVSKELIVDEKVQKLIYLMNLDGSKLEDNEKQELELGYEYIFKYLIEKLEKEYKIFSNTYMKIKDKIEDFTKLNEKEKKSTINGLIDLMCTGQGNLKEIGLTNREGRKSGQKFKTERLLNMTFLDKSVTGMYERRFKINGMENSSSK